VLNVDGDTAPADRPMQGESAFLDAALSPAGGMEGDLLATEVTSIAGIRDRNLRDYQAVVLANVRDLPPGLVEGLKTFVRREGKGLMIFLGDEVVPERYNAVLGEEARLLPGRLGRLLESVPGAEEDGFGFATEELSHPIVNFFMDDETRAFLAKPRFTRAYAIQVPEQQEEEAEERVSVVARFVGGEPALTERRAGRGKVLLFASSADKDWGDFPLHPAYLIVTRRMAQQVTLGYRPSTTVLVHDPLIQVLSAKQAGGQVDVAGPRDARQQITALLSSSGAYAKAETTATPFAGFYTFSDPQGEAPPALFAVNPPRRESALQALGADGVRERYPNLDFQWVDGSEAIGSLITEKRVGKEIWPLLFALACACLIVESLLALRWAPRGT